MSGVKVEKTTPGTQFSAQEDDLIVNTWPETRGRPKEIHKILPSRSKDSITQHINKSKKIIFKQITRLREKNLYLILGFKLKAEIHEDQFVENTLKRARSSEITPNVKEESPLKKPHPEKKAESPENSEELSDDDDDDDDEEEPSFSIAPQKVPKSKRQSDVQAVATFGQTEARITYSTFLHSVITQDLTPIVQQHPTSGLLLIYLYKPYQGECHITQMVNTNSLKFEITWPGTTFAQLKAFEGKVPGWEVSKEQESELLSKPNFPSRQGIEIFLSPPYVVRDAIVLPNADPFIGVYIPKIGLENRLC